MHSRRHHSCPFCCHWVALLLHLSDYGRRYWRSSLSYPAANLTDKSTNSVPGHFRPRPNHVRPQLSQPATAFMAKSKSARAAGYGRLCCGRPVCGYPATADPDVIAPVVVAQAMALSFARTAVASDVVAPDAAVSSCVHFVWGCRVATGRLSCPRHSSAAATRAEAVLFLGASYCNCS